MSKGNSPSYIELPTSSTYRVPTVCRISFVSTESSPRRRRSPEKWVATSEVLVQRQDTRNVYDERRCDRRDVRRLPNNRPVLGSGRVIPGERNAGSAEGASGL